MSGCYKRVNFYDLCRLCAQNIQRNKAKIFDQEGLKIQLQSKIKKCLSITVNEDDCLPKVVCLKCIKQLEVCNAFREECLNSETMLSSYYKNYRHTEDFKKSGKVYIKDTVKYDAPSESPPLLMNKLDSPSKIVKSDKRDNIFVSSYQQDFELSPKFINNGQASASNQMIPNKKLKSEPDHHSQNIMSSVQSVQIPYNIDVINETLKKAVQQLPKDILNKVIVNSNGEVINFAPSETLNMDAICISSNALNELTSVLKNKMVKVKESLKQEKDMVSMEPNIIKIDLTDDNIQDIPSTKYATIPVNKNGQSNAQSNVQNPTVIFPVPQYQNNSFNSIQNDNLTYPQQTNVNISPTTPTVINVICSHTSHPLSNITSVNQSPPSSINMDDLRGTNYIPAVSQKSSVPRGTVFVTEDIVKKEKLHKTVDQVKIHACEVCSKTFKRREHLYQHVKLHSGFRPYRCTECNKSFVRKEHLLRHMVLHSGERNYACDICTKSFSRHDNLLKHIRTHNKEPSYTCEVCKKAFTLKLYYEAHRNEQGKCYLAPPQIRAC